MLLWNGSGSDGGVLASFFLGQVETCILGHALASIIVLGAKMEHGGFQHGALGGRVSCFVKGKKSSASDV